MEEEKSRDSYLPGWPDGTSMFRSSVPQNTRQWKEVANNHLHSRPHPPCEFPEAFGMRQNVSLEINQFGTRSSSKKEKCLQAAVSPALVAFARLPHPTPRSPSQGGRPADTSCRTGPLQDTSIGLAMARMGGRHLAMQLVWQDALLVFSLWHGYKRNEMPPPLSLVGRPAQGAYNKTSLSSYL